MLAWHGDGAPRRLAVDLWAPRYGSPGHSTMQGAPRHHWVVQLLLKHFLRQNLTSSVLLRVV